MSFVLVDAVLEETGSVQRRLRVRSGGVDDGCRRRKEARPT
ncbi:hypothetical protein [Streptomyces noursei]|nr:hypothetical protein [Streptomyces noursei]